jgi:DNA-binding CsgD family transcriptional regulator
MMINEAEVLATTSELGGGAPAVVRAGRAPGLAVATRPDRDPWTAWLPTGKALAFERSIAARLSVDDFDGARRALARAKAVAGHSGDLQDATAVEQLALGVSLYEGRLWTLREECETAIAGAAWRGDAGAGTVATAHALLSVADVHQGMLEQARRHLRVARRLASFATCASYFHLHLLLAEGLVFESESRPDLAVRTLLPIFDEPAAWTAPVLADPSIVAILCRIAGRAERHGLGCRLIAFAEQLATELGDPPALVAIANQAKGNLGDDTVLLVEAARLLSGSPRRLAAASAHEDAALLLEGPAEAQRAVNLAKQALVLYEDCGATAPERRVRQWLRVRGVNMIPGQRRGRPSFGWDAISEAEMRVVELVAEGLTNRQVAERLYLSPYTVDTHLRHVFAKLGLKSRVALTRACLDRPGDR